MCISSFIDGFVEELEKISQDLQKLEEGKKPFKKITNVALGAFTPLASTAAMYGMTAPHMFDKTLPYDNPNTHKRVRQIQEEMGMKNMPLDVHTDAFIPYMGLKSPTPADNSPTYKTPTATHPPFEPKKLDRKKIESKIKKVEWEINELKLKREDLKGRWKQPGSKFVVGAPPQTPESMIAHELGHVKNHSRWGLGFTAGSGISRRLSTTGAPIAAGIAAGQENPNWTPGLVQAGISAPMLLDEAAASARAGKHLVSKYGLGQGLKKALPLAPAFGTYAAMGLSPLAITAGRKLYRRYKTKQQEKQASAVSMGALLGGSAGYGLTRGIKGVLAGAALGGLAGKAVSAGNRIFIKGPEEQKQMLAHMPSRATQDYVPSWLQQSQNMYPY